MDGYQVASKVLSGHVEQLKLVAEALLEFETIDGEDIDVVLRGGRIERRPPPRPPVVPVVEAKETRPGLFARPPVLPLKEEPEKA